MCHVRTEKYAQKWQDKKPTENPGKSFENQTKALRVDFCSMFSFFPELISEEEWKDLDTIQFEDQLNYWNLEDSRFRARFSEQTWLDWNENETGVLNDLRER